MRVHARYVPPSAQVSKFDILRNLRVFLPPPALSRRIDSTTRPLCDRFLYRRSPHPIPGFRSLSRETLRFSSFFHVVRGGIIDSSKVIQSDGRLLCADGVRETWGMSIFRVHLCSAQDAFRVACGVGQLSDIRKFSSKDALRANWTPFERTSGNALVVRIPYSCALFSPYLD